VPTIPVQQQPTRRLCGAKCRDGHPCSQPAMPNGRCRMHGGKSLKGVASPSWRHGRHSRFLPPALRPAFESTLRDPDYLALGAEIAVVDARVAQLLSTLGTNGSAPWSDAAAAMRVLEQSISADDESAVHRALDQLRAVIHSGDTTRETWRELYVALNARRRLTDAERRRVEAAATSLTREQALALVGALCAAVKEEVRDTRALQAISIKFGRIARTAGADLGVPSAANDA